MTASAESGGEPRITGHYKYQSALAADPRQSLSERQPARVRIVAQNHAGQPTRQSSDGSPRVGQAARIGKQPERRHTLSPSRGTITPGEQTLVQCTIRIMTTCQIAVT